MKVPFLLIPCLLFLAPVLRAQTIEIEKLDPNMTLEKADSVNAGPIPVRSPG
jgi:hypothetical protein